MRLSVLCSVLLLIMTACSPSREVTIDAPSSTVAVEITPYEDLPLSVSSPHYFIGTYTPDPTADSLVVQYALQNSFSYDHAFPDALGLRGQLWVHQYSASSAFGTQKPVLYVLLREPTYDLTTIRFPKSGVAFAIQTETGWRLFPEAYEVSDKRIRFQYSRNGFVDWLSPNGSGTGRW